MKKIFALVLSLLLAMSLSVAAFASEPADVGLPEPSSTVESIPSEIPSIAESASSEETTIAESIPSDSLVPNSAVSDESGITPPPAETPIGITGTPNEDGLVVESTGNASVELTDDSVNFNPRTRTGYAIVTGTNGVRDGELTAENPWDYHLFMPDGYWSMARMVTTNPAFTMTLAVANIDTGMIELTNYTLGPNAPHTMDLQAIVDSLGNQQVLAWLIQSTDGSAGTYKLQYNIAIPLDSSQYKLLTDISADYQQWSMLRDNRFYQNGVLQSLSFYAGYGFNNGGSWHNFRLSVSNCNVDLVHIGGARWKEGITNPSYSNTFVFKVLPGGGTFEHEFKQNPPYYDWGTNDAAGYPTPRQFGSEVNLYGGSYLVYDRSTGQVVEFVSSFSKQWSGIGDHSGFTLF